MGHLPLDALFEVVIELEGARQFVEITALHKVIRLDGEQGGKVHLGGQLHVGHLTRQGMGVEGAGKLGVNPARRITLTLLGQVLLDLLALGTVDMTVGPGGRHHGADQQGCTGIQRIALQSIEGLGRLRRARLLGLQS